MNTPRKLRVAQIGVGNFGAYRRLKMRETGLFQLVAAYDYNPQFLEDARREDGAVAVGSYEALLDFPGVEGVVISTGAKFHAAQIVAALEAGLPVFVEKSLCTTPDEVFALVEAQKRVGLPVGMGHQAHQAQAHARTIQNLIQSGGLGQIVSVEATTCHSGGFQIAEGDWRSDPTKNPGGMLFQCGVHKLHELMFYLGPVKNVSARMRYDVNASTQTADAALVHLEFENGVLGSLNAYHVTPYKHFIHIYGTKANLYLDYFGPNGLELLRQNAAPDYNGARETAERVNIGEADDETANLKSWARAIREGGDPSPSLCDGARAVSVVFTAEAAAKSGKIVEVMI